jgi:hypothetical protein
MLGDEKSSPDIIWYHIFSYYDHEPHVQKLNHDGLYASFTFSFSIDQSKPQSLFQVHQMIHHSLIIMGHDYVHNKWSKFRNKYLKEQFETTILNLIFYSILVMRGGAPSLVTWRMRSEHLLHARQLREATTYSTTWVMRGGVRSLVSKAGPRSSLTWEISAHVPC